MMHNNFISQSTSHEAQMLSSFISFREPKAYSMQFYYLQLKAYLFAYRDIDLVLNKSQDIVEPLLEIQKSVIEFYNKFNIDNQTIKKHGIQSDHFWRFLLQLNRVNILDEYLFSSLFSDMKVDGKYYFIELEKIIRTLLNLDIQLSAADVLVDIMQMKNTIKHGKVRLTHHEQSHSELWQIRSVLEYAEKFKDNLDVNQSNFKSIILSVRAHTKDGYNLTDLLYKHTRKDVIPLWNIAAKMRGVIGNAIAEQFLSDFKLQFTGKSLSKETKLSIESVKFISHIPSALYLKIVSSLKKYKNNIPRIYKNNHKHPHYFKNDRDILQPAYDSRMQLVNNFFKEFNSTVFGYENLKQLIRKYRGLNITTEHKYNSSSYKGISPCLNEIEDHLNSYCVAEHKNTRSYQV